MEGAEPGKSFQGQRQIGASTIYGSGQQVVGGGQIKESRNVLASDLDDDDILEVFFFPKSLNIT